MKPKFVGTYTHTLDSKKRLTIPSEIRDIALRRRQYEKKEGLDVWYYSIHRNGLVTLTDDIAIIEQNYADWFEVKPDKNSRINLGKEYQSQNAKHILTAKGDYLILEEKNKNQPK